MVIHPRIRGFICTTTHPEGCARNVLEQIRTVQSDGPREGGPKRVLVIGASTGYGLAARITAAFGYGSATLGVFFEKPGAEKKPGTAGWYNSAAFDRYAKEAGLFSRSINGDAYSDEVRDQAIEIIRNEMDGPIDLVVYSLASPVRRLPDTGEIKRSALKPIGASYRTTAVDTNRDQIIETEVEPATPEEVADTIRVMGGEDWELWIDALARAGVLAADAKSVAFSYIGTDITWPIYWHGALGKAKEDLDRAAHAIDARLGAGGGQANVAVLKSVVTQASAAIPVMPLYIALVFRLMKDRGLHEEPIDQAERLFREHLYATQPPPLDEAGRMRLDDRELREDVQLACRELWPQVTTENLFDMTDYAAYKQAFLKLFGFGRDDVDYDADVDPRVDFDVIDTTRATAD